MHNSLSCAHLTTVQYIIIQPMSVRNSEVALNCAAVSPEILLPDYCFSWPFFITSSYIAVIYLCGLSLRLGLSGRSGLDFWPSLIDLPFSFRTKSMLYNGHYE